MHNDGENSNNTHISTAMPDVGVGLQLLDAGCTSLRRVENNYLHTATAAMVNHSKV